MKGPGIYFIAAGTSSRNRQKSLDRSFRVEELEDFLPQEAVSRIHHHFPQGAQVFLWGANDGRSFRELSKATAGCSAVDVKNKKVVQIFTYCFCLKTRDTRLQEYVGWDREKPKDKRRPYLYVYFLKGPRSTSRTDKAYFQRAFREEGNQNWLVGQRWFDGEAVAEAMQRTNSPTLETFLGIEPVNATRASVTDSPKTVWRRVPRPEPVPEPVASSTSDFQAKEPEEVKPVTSKHLPPPEWLRPVARQVESLKQDPDHQERDHEDLVRSLLSALGYLPITEIKFRRGRIDVAVYRGKEPLMVIEVKKDWALSSANRDYITQAYGYALEAGARYVLVTNGDKYLIYDRKRGLSYKENHVGTFQISTLTASSLSLLGSLRKGALE